LKTDTHNAGTAAPNQDLRILPKIGLCRRGDGMHHVVFPTRQCSRAFKTVGGICQDGDFLPAHQRQNFDTDFNRHRSGGNQGEEETGFEHREIHHPADYFRCRNDGRLTLPHSSYRRQIHPKHPARNERLPNRIRPAFPFGSDDCTDGCRQHLEIHAAENGERPMECGGGKFCSKHRIGGNRHVGEPALFVPLPKDDAQGMDQPQSVSWNDGHRNARLGKIVRRHQSRNPTDGRQRFLAVYL